jgi:DNA-binding transcriptional MocR family regulator
MSKYGQYNDSSDNMINLGLGQPNNSILPIDWFQQVCGIMANDRFGPTDDDHSELLQYGANNGYNDIKIKLAKWLNKKYYTNKKYDSSNIITSDQLFMTNGCTSTLHILISKYNESGDTILVDNPTYFIALNIFKEYGLNIEGIDFNSDGVDIEMIDEKITELNSNEKTRQGVLFYYTVPSYHNPTGVTISHKKRKLLAKLCEKHRNLYIIADEVYHFLSWDDNKLPPMADYHPKIVSVGSFSKILAPALRVGWLYQNTNLENYKDEYSFISGDSGLNHSSVLNSSGGLNPIGYKFVEYALEIDKQGECMLDTILSNIIGYLQTNCTIMLEYMEQFNNIIYTKPTGGYFIWLKLKNITNTMEFLKYCENNNIKFHPGLKFSIENDYNSYIRLSFSYYNPSELITGLERLMDCVTRYNKINVMIHGINGDMIKKQVLANDDMTLIDDMSLLSPFNSVIVDTSNNTSILQQLIKNKSNIPLIIGINEMNDATKKLVQEYKSLAPIIHIDNFSEGNPLFVNFTKLLNHMNSDWKINIKSISEQLEGEQQVELTNGLESIKLVHNVNNNEAYAKGCIVYIYWIVNCNNGYYSTMTNNIITIGNHKMIKLNKDIPLKCYNHMLENLSNTCNDIIGTFKNNKNNSFDVTLYKKETKLLPIYYDMNVLILLSNYIRETYDLESIVFNIDNSSYDFKYKKDSLWAELPILEYVKKSDDSIHELIGQTTNMSLLGICRYKHNDSYYLVLEVRDSVLTGDILETIATLINYNLTESDDIKYNIIFLNNNYNNTIDIRFFNTLSVESTNDCYSYVAAFEYYMYHFEKTYHDSSSLTINMKNKVVEMVCDDNINYIILAK